MPRKQWRCFHCDEVFTSEKYAREHFGFDQFQTPACKLTQAEGHLIGYIRKLEAELDEHRSESHATLLAAYSYHIDAQASARQAEERGYDKGVSDTMDLCRKESPNV
jgi:hypothetical protein